MVPPAVVVPPDRCEGHECSKAFNGMRSGKLTLSNVLIIVTAGIGAGGGANPRAKTRPYRNTLRARQQLAPPQGIRNYAARTGGS